MAKVNYASLKLKVNTDVESFDWGEGENKKVIEVLQYLPVSDKYDLVMITLQKSREGEVYNPIKLDMYFHLHLVYMYTNISFTDKQKEDEEKLYDTLESNGLMTEIIKHMPESEYNDVYEKMQDYLRDSLKYETTAAALIKSLIQDLPTQAQAAMDIVNNFDPEKFKAVKDFAEAANGGRPIPKIQ